MKYSRRIIPSQTKLTHTTIPTKRPTEEFRDIENEIQQENDASANKIERKDRSIKEMITDSDTDTRGHYSTLPTITR